MISVVYCTREHNPEHIDHLKKMVGHPKAEIIEYVNEGESLTKFYNRALKEAQYDIILFTHDDVILQTKQIASKLSKMYNKNPEYAILGAAGSKNMPESGKWWEQPKKMYGQVSHQHKGNTWLSAYSPSQGDDIEETIIVDGVFFSVHRERIKEHFDETVEGFHFYEIDFCFRNHLAGAKVGVHTKFKLIHKSIGETNEQWEENRKQFAEKFKDKLPVNIPQKFEKRRMKILIGCLNFQGLTGSEISTLETAKGLSKLNCDVSVISTNVSPQFKKICDKHNIKTFTMQNPPFTKMGDGKWVMNTPQGPHVSEPNRLYKVAVADYDIIHANHTPITNQLLQIYPECNFINIVRSEVIDLENPIVHDNIKKYIAIRPSIKDYVVENFDIPEDKVNVIYNPFDSGRFKPNTIPSGTDKPVTLFVGTMDYLRQAPINDLVNQCRDKGKELWLVGKDSGQYAAALGQEHEHVKYFPPTDNIEDFFYKCDETAGIMLGRTTIEGFLCGKPAIIYNVNKHGHIISEEFMEVPKDLSIFDYDTVIQQIKDTYIEAYNE
jgi:glycosyltransferase involved in cell wall biosynthesis